MNFKLTTYFFPSSVITLVTDNSFLTTFLSLFDALSIHAQITEIIFQDDEFF